MTLFAHECECECECGNVNKTNRKEKKINAFVLAKVSENDT